MLAEPSQEAGDDDGICNVHEEPRDERHDNERAVRPAVLFGNGCHVSHCGGTRADRNAGEARADDGRFVVAAHETKDDKQCEDHSEDRLRGEDRENGSGDINYGP